MSEHNCEARLSDAQIRIEKLEGSLGLAEDEIKRLREALIEISKLNTTYHPFGDRFDDGLVGGHQDAVDIAKAALEGK